MKNRRYSSNHSSYYYPIESSVTIRITEGPTNASSFGSTEGCINMSNETELHSLFPYLKFISI